MRKSCKCMLVGLTLLILTVIVVLLLISPKTEYSSEYEKTFGKFAAKTATVCLKEETNTCSTTGVLTDYGQEEWMDIYLLSNYLKLKKWVQEMLKEKKCIRMGTL